MSKRKRVRQKAAAEALGITDRRLREWEKEAWWDPAFRNSAGYDVAAIKAARDAMGRKGSEQSQRAQQLTEEEKHEEIGIKRERRRIAELDRLKAEGELLPRAAWELFAAELLTAVGDWCDQLPQIVAAQLPKKYRGKLKKALKAELDRKRSELRGELERKAKELNDAKAD